MVKNKDSHDATRQIETNTGIQLLGTSFVANPLVLTRLTVRVDGRTQFPFVLRAQYDSPLCVLGESVFALSPDREVRAAKLTNRWISGCLWRRDVSSDENLWCERSLLYGSADQFAENHLEISGTVVKRLRHVDEEEFDVEMDAGVPAPLETRKFR